MIFQIYHILHYIMPGRQNFQIRIWCNVSLVVMQ